jgi:hypothetical protein
MTGDILCCLADVIRTELELLDLDLGVYASHPKATSFGSPKIVFLPSQVTHGRESRLQIPVATFLSTITKLFPGRKYLQAVSTAAPESGITEQERLTGTPSTIPATPLALHPD